MQGDFYDHQVIDSSQKITFNIKKEIQHDEIDE
jgi:hypothetical protein